jgi:hypothetical protein
MPRICTVRGELERRLHIAPRMAVAISGSLAGLRRISSWGVFSAATSATVCALGQDVPAKSITTVPAPSRSGWFIGGYAVAFVPVGDWTDHPYAGRTLGSVTYDDDLDQFGPGIGAGIELGWKAKGALTLTLQAERTTLATGEWEAEAARHGSNVVSNAAQTQALFFLSVELLGRDPWRMDLRFGIGMMDASGKESLRDPAISYEYDFLRASFAARGGIGGGYRVSPVVDLMLLVDAVWATPGVRYPEHSAAYLGIVTCLGPRFWFSAPRGTSKGAP